MTNSDPTDKKLGPQQWQNMLEQLDSGGDGVYYYPKDGRTRMRLLPVPNSTNGVFYRQTARHWQGQMRNRYIFFAVVLTEEEKNQVKVVVTNKTVLKGILQLLAEGYDLLDFEEGTGITLVRAGKGLETTYNVMPSKKPLPIDPGTLEWPEQNLSELATEFERKSRERDETRQSNETPQTPESIPDKLRKSSKESTGEDW